MADPLELVLQRVERAKEQRRDLEREMRAWTEAGAYKVGSQIDPKTGNTVFYVGQLAEVTPRMAALISEILHTLRTALDNLAYQLFLICRTDSTDEGIRIEFPIYDDSKTTESNAFRPIKALREEVVEVFHKIQPCKSRNPLLWALHRLDIIDKHRRIVTATLKHHSVFVRDAMRQLLIEGGYADMIPILELRPTFFTSHRTGRRAQVGDVLFAAPPGYNKVNEKLQFTFDVAFDEPGIIEGKSVIETIDELIPLVERIVACFAPFFV